jgi:hypothetical protein
MPPRDDLSDLLVHLTRVTERGVPQFQAATETLVRIMNDQALRGGTGYIKGNYKCVCFSEAPLAKLSLMLANGDASSRYSPFGVMVKKIWLFGQGGRPVIYQPDSEFEILPDELRYRHVRYKPPQVDFTREREWRIKTDWLPLDPFAATLVAPTRDWLLNIRKRFEQTSSLSDYLKWHFLVLEDLGVSIAEPDPLPVIEEFPLF